MAEPLPTAPTQGSPFSTMPAQGASTQLTHSVLMALSGRSCEKNATTPTWGISAQPTAADSVMVTAREGAIDVPWSIASEEVLLHRENEVGVVVAHVADCRTNRSRSQRCGGHVIDDSLQGF